MDSRRLQSVFKEPGEGLPGGGTAGMASNSNRSNGSTRDVDMLAKPSSKPRQIRNTAKAESVSAFTSQERPWKKWEDSISRFGTHEGRGLREYAEKLPETGFKKLRTSHDKEIRASPKGDSNVFMDSRSRLSLKRDVSSPNPKGSDAGQESFLRTKKLQAELSPRLAYISRATNSVIKLLDGHPQVKERELEQPKREFEATQLEHRYASSAEKIAMNNTGKMAFTPKTPSGIFQGAKSTGARERLRGKVPGLVSWSCCLCHRALYAEARWCSSCAHQRCSTCDVRVILRSRLTQLLERGFQPLEPESLEMGRAGPLDWSETTMDVQVDVSEETGARTDSTSHLLVVPQTMSPTKSVGQLIDKKDKSIFTQEKLEARYREAKQNNIEELGRPGTTLPIENFRRSFNVVEQFQKNEDLMGAISTRPWSTITVESLTRSRPPPSTRGFDKIDNMSTHSPKNLNDRSSSIGRSFRGTAWDDDGWGMGVNSKEKKRKKKTAPSTSPHVNNKRRRSTATIDIDSISPLLEKKEDIVELPPSRKDLSIHAILKSNPLCSNMRDSGLYIRYTISQDASTKSSSRAQGILSDVLHRKRKFRLE